MRKIIGKLYASSVVRYVFFGGCTTLVNLVSFYLLRRAGIGINIANLTSIVLAVLFAYVVNARFVFQARPETVRESLSKNMFLHCRYDSNKASRTANVSSFAGTVSSFTHFSTMLRLYLYCFFCFFRFFKLKSSHFTFYS